MLKRYPEQVNIVFKNYPLRNHKYARTAAAAVLAAHAQGKFWEFHHLLFENYKKLNDAKITEIAQSVGLDMEQFELDRKSPGVQGLISRDMREASLAGLRGTPTLYINGKKLSVRSISNIYEMIENEIDRSG